MWILETIFDKIANELFSLFRKTPLYKKIMGGTAALHINNRLQTTKKIMKEVSKFNFDKFEDTKQICGINLKSFYEDDMREMTIIDKNRKKHSIQIPYLEIINFTKTPNADIKISCSPESPLLVSEKYHYPENIERATYDWPDRVKKKNPKTFNGLHPRLASMKHIKDDIYECKFEITDYFTQIRSNLSLDYHMDLDGRDTTVRTLEREQHMREMKDWQKKGIPNDPLHPRCLTSLDNSLLANVVGVSAIWAMGDLRNPKIYLMLRNNKVGVYRNKRGMPSGDIELPKYNRHVDPDTTDYYFRDSSLVEYLKWEIAREFAEETGIRDITKNLNNYSINVDGNKIGHAVEMEIIPLAFTREMLRGGKPQMFFLIHTETLPKSLMKECFVDSLGKDEFKEARLTTAPISAEVAANYLYALEYIQRNMDGTIELA